MLSSSPDVIIYTFNPTVHVVAISLFQKPDDYMFN